MLSTENKIFLQEIIGHTLITIPNAISLLAAINAQLNEHDEQNQKEIDQACLKSTVREINAEIIDDRLKIVFGTCEVTCVPHIVLICTKRTDASRMQSFYSPLECSYWRPLMDAIIKSDERSLTRNMCLNITAMAIPMKVAEDFIGKCVQKGYLVVDKEHYHLGCTALLEFSDELRSTYDEFVEICELCSEICCLGKSCMNCNKLMHAYCLKNTLERTNNKKCPLCHVNWDSFDFEAQPGCSTFQNGTTETTSESDSE